MNSDNKKIYDEEILNLFDGINEDYKNWTSGWDEPTRTRKNFEAGLSVKSGRKFDKIIKENSVWGFVAKTDGVLKGIPYNVGDVFKAASWSSPAKHVRGTIFTDNTNWYQWTGPNYL